MLYVREHWVNETEGYRGGNSPVYESFTDDVGTLFRSARKEHGRCTGKIYWLGLSQTVEIRRLQQNVSV